MKLGFKRIILIIVISLISGAIGAYGYNTIYGNLNKHEIVETENITTSAVDYKNVNAGSFIKAIDKAINTVVEITSTSSSTQSFYGVSESTSKGSGVIISSDGYIVTNAHVVEGATSVSVKLYNDKEYDAQIIGSDTRSDVALLKINETGLEYSYLADSDELELGQDVIVIGNPLGLGISCSNGIISATDVEVIINNYPMSLLQTNAAVNEGNSGGGLFNLNGDLVGIVNAKKSSVYTQATVEGMGYAIPSNTVSKIVTDLAEYGYVKNRATIGIKVYNSPVEIGDTVGLYVTEVLEESGASKAGIKVGDVITEVDGTSITSYADLSKLLNKHEVGDEVVIKAYRENTQKEFKVTLQENSN